MKSLKQIREASGGKEAYQKFFNSILKKFGVSSPSELEGKKKKDFFDAIDKGWDGDNEKAEKNETYDDPDNLDPETTHNPDETELATGKKLGEKVKPVQGNRDEYYRRVDTVNKKFDIEPIGKRSLSDLKPGELKKYFAAIDKVLGHDESVKKPNLVKVTETSGTEDEKLAERLSISEIYSRAQMKKAIGIARKSKGQYTKAYNAIEKIAKGLADEHIIANALKKANEAHEIGTDKYKKHCKKNVPGQNEAKTVKLNRPEKHIFDLSMKAIARSSEAVKARTSRSVERYMDYEGMDLIDDITGVSLNDREKNNVYNAVRDELMKKVRESVDEAIKAGRGKIGPRDALDVDFMGDKKDAKFASTKWKINIKLNRMGADISGDKQKILAYLRSDDYGMDDMDIEDLFPELLEAVDCDARLMGFKAAVRRKEGEKQKGRVIVDRRTKGAKDAQLRSEKAKAKREAAKKKKEFAEKYPKLDYQYGNDADLEEILTSSNKKLYGETAANSVASGNVDMAPNAGKKKKKSLKVIKRDSY